MSTMEKNFNWSSRMAGKRNRIDQLYNFAYDRFSKICNFTKGTTTAAWDVGNIIANIAVAYVASRGHRTRWIGAGLLLVGATCFIKVIPYLIFGPGETARMYTKEYSLNGSDFNWLGTILILSDPSHLTLHNNLLVFLCNRKRNKCGKIKHKY